MIGGDNNNEPNYESVATLRNPNLNSNSNPDSNSNNPAPNVPKPGPLGNGNKVKIDSENGNSLEVISGEDGLNNGKGKGTLPQLNKNNINKLLRGAKETKNKGFLERQKDKLMKEHRTPGGMKQVIDNLIGALGSYVTLFVLILTVPAMPVIFYLTILYNVIILTWEKFKNLDTYKGK